MEILTPLMFGACVCVPSEQARLDNITGVIQHLAITWAVLTPSVSRLINPMSVTTLKTLVMGGEAMSQSDILRWKGHVNLHNGYGPSECSVACAWNGDVRGDPTNIGRSIGGVCWVVDPNDVNRLVPIGAIGELVVEGFTVAKGYLSNEEKTAEVFVKPPKWLSSRRSGNATPERLYLTGDLVRYNSDGSFNFISRKDTQAKFHGQRIEFGEIEHHVLSRSPDIAADVVVEVVKPEVRRQQQTLAAFFTTANTPQALASTAGAQDWAFSDLSSSMEVHLQALQDGLAEALPPYMIPTVWIPVTSLPRNAAGKLDRKTLRREAELLSADALNKYSLLTAARREPTTAAEHKLRQAWTQTLGTPLSTIGSDTSFFRVGGDSLSAMRLVSTARELGLVLSVADIFNNPKLSRMAEAAQRLQPEMASDRVAIKPFALFGDDEALKGLVEAAAEQCGVEANRILDLYPCTPLQEGMITLSMQKPGAYMGQNAFRLPQAMDARQVRSAWEQLVAANPILRTRIVNTETAGILQAVVDGTVEWVERTCSLQEYLDTEAPLNVRWGVPLCRFALLETPERDAIFVWTAHHCLFDGWSQGLIFEQLEQAYRGQPLTALTPFNHFIDFLANSDDGACTDFWSSQLEGNTPSTLPPAPAQGYTPKADRVSERKLAMAGAEASLGIMPSTILRAAWALTMARYTDADDVVFGSTMSGRNAPVQNIAQVNGPTITTVPIKIHVDRGLATADFLEMVQAQATAMVPFEHWGLQRISQLGKNAGFQNLFVVQPGRDSERPLGLEEIEVDESDFSTYPLIVECFLLGGGKVNVRTRYDAAVAPFAPQLGILFEQVVRQLIQHIADDATLSSLELCSSEDKTQLFSWNHSDPICVDYCLHDLVRSRVAKTPDASAVCSWDFNLTYAELDGMATALALHLVSLGVAPEVIVPAVFEKSAWTVVAQLAILKAGGALCMLDPSNPKARLETIIDTVGATLVLASEAHSRLLDNVPGRRILVVNQTGLAQLNAHPTGQTSLPQVNPGAAAYVVFTSGTTGKPKGSVTEHRAFASQSASLAPAMEINSASRVLQYSAYSFDPYILETFTTLIEGGCVCIVKDDARTNPVDLVDTICSLGVTWALLTPSVARLLPRDDVSSLKTLVLGGEAMARSDRAWSDSTTLMNAYGPSECSVASVLNPRVTLDSEHTTIGKGVGGRCWIVEPENHQRLAPVGCTGELLIESPGLARGYLEEAQKTADVFITSPTWLKNLRPGSRLYKTGDLVRYDPATGNINFVGRKDLQVKLHGQRLELGEIEHQISASGVVESVAVTLPKSGAFRGKLVATLSLKSLSASRAGDVELELVDALGRATTLRQLADVRGHLESQVPSYMVPSIWTVVYAIPLTLSLKTNKRKISTWLEAMGEELVRQVMDISNGADEPVVCEASTAMEERLQDIVAKVLNLPVDQVHLNRSFIGLGGDSITAMQLVARCRTQNITVKVKDILQSKTIVKLAEFCVAVGAGENRDKFEEETPGIPFALTPIQQLYFEVGLGQSWGAVGTSASLGSQHFNQSTLVLLKRRVTIGQLKGAIVAIVKQHSMLRARFAQVNGTWMQTIRPDGVNNHTFTHHKLRSSIDMLPIIAASQQSLDAEGGVVFSVDSFDVVDEGQHLVFFAAHHLVVDLVSWRIILQDLEEFINTGSLFSKKPLPFQTWSRLQGAYAAQNLRAEKAAALPSLPPAQFSYWGMGAPANFFGDTITATFSLDADATSSLLGGDCNGSFGTEPTDLFIAALQDSFARVFTDRAVPPVYCEGHGREPWDGDIDLSSTVGWFTTLYPVHSAGLDSDSGLLDAIRRTKDARRRVADNGWSYFASRFLAAEGHAAFANHWPMEILFNYMGLQQQLERQEGLLREVPLAGTVENGTLAPTADVGPRCPRLAMFDVSVQISNGEAVFSILYNRHALHGDKIRKWVHEYQQSLWAAARQLPRLGTRPTLSDFPLLPLSYEDLERIHSTILPSLSRSSFDEIDDMYSLAPTQKGIVISQARSGGAYRETFLYAVSSRGPQPADLQRLAAAWQKVVALHASLRTVILDDLCAEESYGQVVLASWFPRILHFECADADAMGEIKRVAAAEYPPTEPAHRMLFCQTEKRIYMQLEISHALIDGGSMGVLFRDLVAAYDGRLQLNEADAPRYRDYVAHIKSLPTEDSMAYWMQHLEGVQPCHIPVLQEGISSDNQSIESISVGFEAQSDRLLRFCRSHGLTPANVFQVAWALVLRHYTGMDHVSFGYLTSGRDAPVHRMEEIIGAVCNMLVFKVDFAGNASALQLLQDAQAAWVNSLQHQFTSLADIQHRQGTSGQPLFNTGMSYRSNAKADDAVLSAASIELDLVTGHDPSEFVVTLNISSDKTGSTTAQFNYRSTHMTAEQAANMIYVLQRAVECTLDLGDSGHPLTRGCLIDEATFRDSPASAPVPATGDIIPPAVGCVDQIIALHAHARPHSPAVCSWDGQLTHMELDYYSTQLAGCLATRYGVSPEDLVPVCMEKSVWFVVSVLAVMKAGAAFVPMDATQPGRFRTIVEQTGARLVLTSAAQAERISQLTEAALVVDASFLRQLPPSPPLSYAHRSPSNACYVLFTSGTTGLAKGVVVEHKAWCSSAVGQEAAWGLDAQTRMLQFASVGFDASLGEVLTTLMVGGCVCIPSEEDRLNDVEATIRRMGVNVTIFSPSFIKVLSPGNIPSVHTMILGGESTPESEIRRWGDKVRLIPAYGPTECSLVSSSVAGLTVDVKPSNIGAPNNSLYWVVDAADHDTLLAAGAIGELLIEGVRPDPPSLAALLLQSTDIGPSRSLPAATSKNRPRQPPPSSSIPRGLRAGPTTSAASTRRATWCS